MKNWFTHCYQKLDARLLSILRLTFGFVFLMKQIGLVALLTFRPLRLGFPKHRFSSVNSYRLDTFNIPYPFADWLPIPSFQVYEYIEVAIFILTLLWVIGFLTRWVGPLMLILYAYLFFLCQLSFSHHLWQFLLVLSVLVFSNCGQYYSIDQIWNNYRQQTPKTAFVAPAWMLKFLISVIYFFTASSKLQAGWWNGQALNLYMSGKIAQNSIVAPILEVFPSSLMGILVIASMYFVSVAIWFPKWRVAAILVGIGIHVGIDLTLSVETYSYQMWALYIVIFYDRFIIQEI